MNAHPVVVALSFLSFPKLSHVHYMVGEFQMIAIVEWSGDQWSDVRAVYSVTAVIVEPTKDNQMDIDNEKRPAMNTGRVVVRTTLDIPMDKVASLNGTQFNVAISEVLSNKGFRVSKKDVKMLSVRASEERRRLLPEAMPVIDEVFSENSKNSKNSKERHLLRTSTLPLRALAADKDMATIRYQLMILTEEVDAVTSYIASEDYRYPLAKAFALHGVIAMEEGECWCDMAENLVMGTETFTVEEKMVAGYMKPEIIAAIVSSLLFCVCCLCSFGLYSHQKAQRKQAKQKRRMREFRVKQNRMEKEQADMQIQVQILEAQKRINDAKQTLLMEEAEALKEQRDNAQQSGDTNLMARLDRELQSVDQHMQAYEASASHLQDAARERTEEIRIHLATQKESQKLRLMKRLESKKKGRKGKKSKKVTHHGVVVIATPAPAPPKWGRFKRMSSMVGFHRGLGNPENVEGGGVTVVPVAVQGQLMNQPPLQGQDATREAMQAKFAGE